MGAMKLCMSEDTPLVIYRKTMVYSSPGRQGQYIKSVTKDTPADLCGMIPGDHVLAVDGADCSMETHHQVVDRVRSEPSMGKRVLVIDQETEREMLAKVLGWWSFFFFLMFGTSVF